MRMRTLGSVLHVTPSKLIIVRLSDPNNIPPLNVEILNASGEKVGVLVDIIGPIESPYAVVKPTSPIALSVAKPSTVLFYRVRSQPKKARRKGGKRR